MANLPADSLELAILLQRNLQQQRIHERQIRGTLPADLDFNEVETTLDGTGLLVASDEHTRNIEFSLPGNFFLSLEELIGTSERRISPPTSFYLADSDCSYRGVASDLPPLVQHYLAATELYELLGRAADYTAGLGSTKKLIFLHKEKIEITPEYTITDLRALPNMDVFKTDFIESETHRDQKQTIVRTVLLEMFAGRRVVPFSELLVQFSDFIEKVIASYQLYVSEFSFQKIKAEVEKEKLDATAKLNKVFSDIQNQLLAVPAALILVGGQMEKTGGWSSKNISIWLGVLVFSILMTLLVRNQRHTLQAVKQEIDQQWLQITGKHQAVASRFESSYRQLDKRYKHQQWLIRVVSLLVASALAVATGMLLWFSVPQQLVLASLKWGALSATPLLVWDIIKWGQDKYRAKKISSEIPSEV